MEGCFLGNPYFLFTGCLSIQIFDSPPTASQATLGYLLLAVQHLCYLQDAMLSQRSPSLPRRHFSPTLYRECYGFKRVFFYSQAFLPYTPSCCFQSLSGASSSTSKIAGLHDDYWNIALARLLHWITAIHKRGILVGSIYVPNSSFEVRVPQSGNLPLTGFEPAFLKIPWVSSHLSWQFSHRFSWVLINK